MASRREMMVRTAATVAEIGAVAFFAGGCRQPEPTVSLVASPAIPPTPEGLVNAKTYRSNTSPYSIDYPPEWVVTELGEEGSAPADYFGDNPHNPINTGISIYGSKKVERPLRNKVERYKKMVEGDLAFREPGTYITLVTDPKEGIHSVAGFEAYTLYHYSPRLFQYSLPDGSIIMKEFAIYTIIFRTKDYDWSVDVWTSDKTRQEDMNRAKQMLHTFRVTE